MRRATGFSIIELMVVMTILGIMMAVGIPSFKNFISNQRAKSTAYELTTSLLMARSEAIKRNANVSVSPVTSGSWISGWTVATASSTLQTQASLDGITITTTTTSVTFSGAGRPGASAKWEITSNGANTRCVKLDIAGSPSSSTGACS